MNKKIEFEVNGEKYVLEYTRESVALMERQGFEADELIKKPMLMLPLAFQGLFYKNHRKITKQEIDKIYKSFKDKDKLMATIVDMLEECYTSLTETEEGEDSGNIDWKIV